MGFKKYVKKVQNWIQKANDKAAPVANKVGIQGEVNVSGTFGGPPPNYYGQPNPNAPAQGGNPVAPLPPAVDLSKTPFFLDGTKSIYGENGLRPPPGYTLFDVDSRGLAKTGLMVDPNLFPNFSDAFRPRVSLANTPNKPNIGVDTQLKIDRSLFDPIKYDKYQIKSSFTPGGTKPTKPTAWDKFDVAYPTFDKLRIQQAPQQAPIRESQSLFPWQKQPIPESAEFTTDYIKDYGIKDPLPSLEPAPMGLMEQAVSPIIGGTVPLNINAEERKNDKKEAIQYLEDYAESNKKNKRKIDWQAYA